MQVQLFTSVAGIGGGDEVEGQQESVEFESLLCPQELYSKLSYDQKHELSDKRL